MVHEKTGSLKVTATRTLLLQGRVLECTLEWVEPANDGSVKEKGEADPGALAKPFSDLFHALSEPTPKPAATAPKEKVKTRGTPHVQTSETAAAGPSNGPQVPQPVFPVDARAVKVLRTPSFNPKATWTPGTVARGDFLLAMTSARFGAKKLYGSVWQVRPTGLDVRGRSSSTSRTFLGGGGRGRSR